MSITLNEIEEEVNNLKKYDSESLGKYDCETLIGMYEALNVLENYLCDKFPPVLEASLVGLVNCSRSILGEHIIKHHKKPEFN